MDRNELEHSVYCSVRIERMTATFNRRLDNAATFLQIVLSLAVFTDVATIKPVGGALAIITVWAFVYRPSVKALLASQQQRRYETLCTRMSTLSDQDLAAALAEFGEWDSDGSDFICHAAENAQHNAKSSKAPHKLNAFQRMLLFISGS